MSRDGRKARFHDRGVNKPNVPWGPVPHFVEPFKFSVLTLSSHDPQMRFETKGQAL